jgi:hypothetical protein
VDIASIRNPPGLIAARAEAIRVALLRDSPHIRQTNFEKIAAEDLEHLFDLYDRQFFDGWLRQAVKARTTAPLTFRLSRTMTRAGGKTILHRRRRPGGEWKIEYQIAVASRMLFMTFGQVDRPVVVSGLTCSDRLEALQRIVEHEIVHLIELVTWGRSSCSAARFKALAANLFGHAGTTHGLVTPREEAAVRHGIAPGGRVEFEYEGRRLVGKVNRIHRRATVLVKDPGGRRYTDGGRYAKFYVPLAMLRPAQERLEVRG